MWINNLSVDYSSERQISRILHVCWRCDMLYRSIWENIWIEISRGPELWAEVSSFQFTWMHIHDPCSRAARWLSHQRYISTIIREFHHEKKLRIKHRMSKIADHLCFKLWKGQKLPYTYIYISRELCTTKICSWAMQPSHLVHCICAMFQSVHISLPWSHPHAYFGCT